MAKIMLVDDEENVLNGIMRFLRKKEGWQASTFTDPTEALKALKTGDYDVIISDYRMPTMDGALFLHETLVFQPDAIRIVLSGKTDFDGLVNFINETGIYKFIHKPVNVNQLIDTIELALQDQALRRENEQLGLSMKRFNLDK